MTILDDMAEMLRRLTVVFPDDCKTGWEIECLLSRYDSGERTS